MTESKKKILFVEDSPELRGQMKEALEQEGYEMLEAADAEEALTISNAEHPDLVLLDLILPAGGGIRILEAFRDSETLKLTPVVVLTNLDDTDHIGQALALGAKSYLVKTHYDLSDIIEHIQLYLSSDKNETA